MTTILSTARKLADFARAVSEAQDVQQAHRLIVAGAAEMLGTPWIAVTRHSARSGVSFVASSDDTVRKLARVVRVTREGVSWQAHLSGEIALCNDLRQERRWPDYRRALDGEVPIRSAVGVTMRCGDEQSGALLAYAAEPGFFDAERVDHVALIADHAGMALDAVRRRMQIDDLNAALRTNREIGTAVGVCMERLHVTREEAINLLRRCSQERQVKLHDIAAQVVFTGELPPVESLPTAVHSRS